MTTTQRIRPFPRKRVPKGVEDYFDCAVYRNKAFGKVVDSVPADDYFNDEGRRTLMRRSLPKQVFRWAINLQGAFVMVVLETDATQRSVNSVVVSTNLANREAQGFIWADQCPIGREMMHPDDERAIFGDDRRCTDHEFGFDFQTDEGRKRRLHPCKHAFVIADIRRAQHAEIMREYRTTDAPADRQIALLEKIAARVGYDPDNPPQLAEPPQLTPERAKFRREYIDSPEIDSPEDPPDDGSKGKKKKK